MEGLLVLLAFGLIGAIVAVICIAVSTAGLKSGLETLTILVRDKILPGLDNLEKIRQLLADRSQGPAGWKTAAPPRSEDISAPAQFGPEPTPPPLPAAYSPPAAEDRAGFEAGRPLPPPPEFPAQPGPEFAEKVPPPEYANFWERYESLKGDIPAQAVRKDYRPDEPDELDQPAGPPPPLRQDQAEAPLDVDLPGAAPYSPPVAAGPETARPEAPEDLRPALPSEASSEPLPGPQLDSAPAPDHAEEAGLPSGSEPATGPSAEGPASAEKRPPSWEPAPPSAFSQAWDQAWANIAPALRNLWRQGSDFLMKEGHIWVVAGVVVLLLGISFFVRYSIVMGWFSPSLRLASASLLGMIIFSAGFRLREKRRGYGLLLQSCGLGVLYLTTVGAVRLYDLLDSLPALGILSLLVALTAVMALWQNAQLLAHVSLIAAFAAPLLVSQDYGNYVGLFAYYCIINAGILIMSFFRPWRRLYLTGFVLTFGIFTVWALSAYRLEYYSSTMPFLAAFYVFYTVMGFSLRPDKAQAGQAGDDVDRAEAEAVAPGEEEPVPASAVRRRLMSTDLTLTILTPLVFLLLTAYIAWNVPYVLAGSAFILGAINIFLTKALLGRRPAQAAGPADGGRSLPRNSAALLLSQGMIYANLALPFSFLNFKPELFRPAWLLGLVWALEGAVIYRSSAANGRVTGRLFGLLLLAVSAVLALYTLFTVEIFRPLLSPTFLLTLLIAAGGLMAADAAQSHRDRLHPFEKNWSAGLSGLVIGWLLAATVLEVGLAGQPVGCRQSLTWLIIAFSLEAGALSLVRQLRPGLGRSARSPIAPEGSGLAASSAHEWPAPPLVEPVKRSWLVWGFVWPPLAAGLLALTYLGPVMAPAPGPLGPEARPWLELAAWLVFGLLYLWLHYQTGRLSRTDPEQGGSAWLDLINPEWFRRFLGLLMALSAALALGRIFISLGWRLGLTERWTEFLRLSPFALLLVHLSRREARAGEGRAGGGAWLPALAALICLWNFLGLTAFPGWAPYVPVLNPLDLIQAAMAIPPLAWLYLRLRRDPEAEGPHRVFYVLAGLLFVWINLVLGRLVHHWLGAPYDLSGILANDSFQTLAAITWGTVGIAAMITGYRSRRRTQWLLGAILIAADVLKLFFVDLSQAGTITRVVSFIGVGLLLILVGYFAPLPPKKPAPPQEVTPA